MTTVKVQHTATLEFLDKSPPVDGKVVMDIGCGDGFASAQFLERGASRVYANDLEIEVSDLIKDSPFLEKVTFVPSKYLGEYQEKIDIVWSHHCLEHQELPIEFLKTAWALLKKGGQLWVTVPNMRDNLNWSVGHTMAYNLPLLCEHLRRAWFYVEAGSYWQQRGHLRARVQRMDRIEFSKYPLPMQTAIDETGRCPAEIINGFNWS